MPYFGQWDGQSNHGTRLTKTLSRSSNGKHHLIIIAILLAGTVCVAVFGGVIRLIFWPLESAPAYVPQGENVRWRRLSDLIALVPYACGPIIFAYTRVGNGVVDYLPALFVWIGFLTFGWVYATGYITRKGMQNSYLRLIFLVLIAPMTLVISVAALPFVFTSSSVLVIIARTALLCGLIAILRWSCARCLMPSRVPDSS